MDAKQQKKLETMPKLYRQNYQKAIGGKSKAAAIKAHCLECYAWERGEVHKCNETHCPLHSYRPYQKLAKKTSSPS